MTFASRLCAAALCAVLVTPVTAADQAKPKSTKPAVDVTKLHDVLENDKALNAFFGKTFGVIRGLVAKDVDAAEGRCRFANQFLASSLACQVDSNCSAFTSCFVNFLHDRLRPCLVAGANANP